MKGIQTLTNYVNKKDGSINHGSSLSYESRFKSGNYEKITSYQCNQNQPFADGTEIINRIEFWKIVRWHYGKKELVCYVEKI
jgi:hypothetical protein